jgi:hypothetical protein
MTVIGVDEDADGMEDEEHSDSEAITDTDFTSSSNEEGVPDHMANRWYLQNFPGPWAKKPYKAVNREDKYRTLTNVKIEKFDGKPESTVIGHQR